MSADYIPELGQAAFGQPCQEFEVPDYVASHLWAISNELDRVKWNELQREYDNPFDNSGNVEGFKNGTFEVHAYSWSDDEQPFNFKWRDVEISWYKYLGRGMSMNRDIDPMEAAEMLRACLQSIT
jgi:hypothetical protein